MSDYNKTSLAIISGSEILSEDDWSMLTDLKGELTETYENAQMFRTRTEMEVSVLNDIKHPTPDSKYWQATREQNVMFNELVLLSYDYRKNLVKIKQLERRSLETEDELEKELIQIDIEKRLFIAAQHRKIAQERSREIRQWHEIKKALIPQLNFSSTDVDEHQLVSYTQRWVKQSLQLTSHTPIAERNNLIGQLVSGLKQCQEKGVLDKVFAAFDDQIRLTVMNNFNQYLIKE